VRGEDFVLLICSVETVYQDTTTYCTTRSQAEPLWGCEYRHCARSAWGVAVCLPTPRACAGNGETCGTLCAQETLLIGIFYLITTVLSDMVVWYHIIRYSACHMSSPSAHPHALVAYACTAVSASASYDRLWAFELEAGNASAGRRGVLR
jgi:hypothetical protein